MTSRGNTRGIAEGALMAAITAIVALIGTFLPILSFITVVVVSLPIILLIVRHNFSIGVLSSVVASFLVTIISGPLVGIGFFVQFMILALAYGYLFKNGASSGRILAVGSLISVLATIAIYSLVIFTGQFDIDAQKQLLYDNLDKTIEMYETNGVMDDLAAQGYSKQDVRLMLEGSLNFVINVVPMLLLVGSGLSALMNFIFARIILRKFSYPIPKFAKFTEWRIPWYYSWGLILGLASFLIGDYYKNEVVSILGQNIIIGYALVLFVIGLSVVGYFLKNYEMTPFFRVFLVFVFIFMFQSIAVITFIIGMIDMVADLRKKMIKK